MDIHLTINDKDIENGIATWTTHRTTEAIDRTLTSGDFTELIEQQVIKQVKPMLDKIVVDLPMETVQKYADRYIWQHVQGEVRTVVRRELGTDDWDKFTAVVKEAIGKLEL